MPVIHCGCRTDSHNNTKGAEAQDKLHGKGMRVANRMKSKTDNKQARCTICSRVHNA